MRKKVQVGICLVLVGTCILGLIGIWQSQNAKRKERLKEKQKEANVEEESDWDESHVIDWDAYFDEGGYFGDYGDESINYPVEDVKGIDIQAEYATVHVKHSEEIFDVEVFTQIGDSRDAISCELENGILKIIQADLGEDSSSDGSYIEVTLPSGTKLDSFHLTQKSGATSLAINGKIESVVISMDGGTIMADNLFGSSIVLDINTTNVFVKEAKFKDAQFCVSEGVLRMDELEVKRRLEVLNTDGSVNATLMKDPQDYSIEVSNQEGTVEIGGEVVQNQTPKENKEAAMVLKTQTGSISLDVSDEIEEEQ